MKYEKGQIIYGVVIILVIVLLLLPSSTSFFNMVIRDIDSFDWTLWLPDLLALFTLALGYVALRLIYKKHSKYRKRYPILLLVIAFLWTVIIQVK